VLQVVVVQHVAQFLDRALAIDKNQHPPHPRAERARPVSISAWPLLVFAKMIAMLSP
jgi:hypothetical protein